MRWLLYLLGRLDGIAAGVIAAARTEERSGAEELVEPLHVHAAVDTIAPAALTGRGVAELVEARLGMAPEEEFAAACRRATGGNPFLLSELVDELAATGVLPIAATAGEVHEIGPRAVRRSVLARLRRLEPACTALAQAVTVLGEGVELAAAAAYADLDPATAAEGRRRAGRGAHPRAAPAAGVRAPDRARGRALRAQPGRARRGARARRPPAARRRARRRRASRCTCSTPSPATTTRPSPTCAPPPPRRAAAARRSWPPACCGARCASARRRTWRASCCWSSAPPS